MRTLAIFLAAATLTVVAQPMNAVAYANEEVRTEIGRVMNVTRGGITVRRTVTKTVEGKTVRERQVLNAKSGFRLYEGDRVQTGAGQRAGITFIDKTRMLIDPNSQVIISKYRFQKTGSDRSAEFRVNTGRVGVDSGELAGTAEDDTLRFTTPTSTLGVRGTTFVIEVDGEFEVESEIEGEE